MEMKQATIVNEAIYSNRLPMLTNRWMGVNDVNTKLEASERVSYTRARGDEDLPENFDRLVQDKRNGISLALLDLSSKMANYESSHTISHGDQKRVDLPLAGGDLLVDRHYIKAEVGHCGTLIVNAYSEDDLEAVRNGLIYVDVKEDAILRLVLISRFNGRTVNNLSVVANVEDGGILHLTQIELGADTSNVSYACDLSGEDAMTTVNAAYIGWGKERLDLYYNVRHMGQFTNSDIQVNGALLDEAHKSFRGTIDFVKGAKGAKGNEEEFAILMSDKAKSVAVPLLLAGEDNVEGNHAASAGRFNSDMLFYIMSRGFDQKSAEGLIVQARMVPALDRIQDEVLKEELKQEIHERIVNR